MPISKAVSDRETPHLPRLRKRPAARRRVGGSRDSFLEGRATCLCVCPPDRLSFHALRPLHPLGCRGEQNGRHLRCLKQEIPINGGVRCLKKSSSRTPASMFPFGNRRACNASSMSWQAWRWTGVKLIFQKLDGTRTRRINATYIELSKVLAISPGEVVGALRRHDPLLAFSWQAVQNSLPEGPIWDIKLEQQALLLGLFTFNLAESSHEVAFWITRSYIPLVNSDKDFLTKKRGRLAGAHPNAWEETRDRGCEYSLLRKRSYRG